MSGFNPTAAFFGGALNMIGNTQANSANQANQASQDVFNLEQQQNAQQYNTQMVNQQEAYQTNAVKQAEDYSTQMADTTHQREIVDLKAAGLNPILAAGGAGNPAPSGVMPSGGATGSDPMTHAAESYNAKNMFEGVANSAQTMGLIDAQGNLLDAQKNKTDAETTTQEHLQKQLDAQTFSTVANSFSAAEQNKQNGQFQGVLKTLQQNIPWIADIAKIFLGDK